MKTLVYLLLVLPAFAWANLFHAGPYLQLPGKDQMIIKWEGVQKKTFSLKYGVSRDNLKTIVKPTLEILEGVKEKALYKVKLKSLTPDSRYFYQVTDGDEDSKIYSFKTFPEDESNFSFLALSDAQHGYEATTKVIRESLMPHAFDNPTLTKGFPIEMALFSGDLVQHGSVYRQWKKQFFDPMAPLLERVPLIPAIGNHELDHRLYFSFFDLPENGSKGFEEHWYYFDLGNVRFIGLDTNTRYRKKIQLDWLKSVLEDAHQKGVDFVVGHFHHPHESELWRLGNTKFSGKIQKIMEDFSLKSNIPSVHLCGHTHGYSRGHSLRANHSMITVAAIGGKLDQWGKHRQKDYLEFLVSLSQYGWVLGEVEKGVNPTLTFKRFSYGDAHSFYDMGIKDEFTLKRYNEVPARPIINNALVRGGKLKISGNNFLDPDNDGHLTTHIQISKNNFKTIKYEDFIHFQNIYKEEDKNQGKSMTDIMVLKKLSRNKGYQARIRYRDMALGWSEWSNIFTL
jgi:hypothetical protein